MPAFTKDLKERSSGILVGTQVSEGKEVKGVTEVASVDLQKALPTKYGLKVEDNRPDCCYLDQPFIFGKFLLFLLF